MENPKKKLSSNAILILLSVIMIIGGTLRFYDLSKIPLGFFCDEASIGYNAYSVLTTGKDEYDKDHPLFFEAFGEYKSPIQIYSAIPFIAMLGLTETATRMPSALYGSIAIIGIFLLTRQINTKNKYINYISLFSAFLLAISPWHIHMSRISLEAISAFITFTIFGLYFFLKSIKNPPLMLISSIFFTFAIYSYFPARIFIPLVGIFLIIFYIKFFLSHLKITVLCVYIVGILLTPMIIHLLNEGGARWEQVSIFAQDDSLQYQLSHVVNNYISHFSPNFLFITGDSGMNGQFITRHSVRGMGELYYFQSILLIIGAFILYKKSRKSFWLIIFLLIVYPVGSMFTIDQSAQATRSSIGIIPLTILSAFGIYPILYMKKKSRNIILILSSLVLFISFSLYVHAYFQNYNKYSSDFWGWQYGPNKIISYFVDHENDYDSLYMEGSFNAPQIFFHFYAANDCRNCYLGVPHEVYTPSVKQLFALTPGYLNDHPEYSFSTKRILYYPDGTIAFLIGEIVQ